MVERAESLREFNFAIPEISPRRAEEIALQCFNFEGVAHVLPGERERNIRIDASGGSYLLKIAPAETDERLLQMQAAALDHLAATAPVLPVPRTIRSGETSVVKLENGLLVSLTNWLPGILVLDARKTPPLQREVARMAAAVGRGLRGFFHPSAGRKLIWDLSRAGDLRSLLSHTNRRDQVKLFGAALTRFEGRSESLRTLRAQVIHNDFNQNNLLVDPLDHSTITGVLDFGDMVFAPLINDLAIATAHQLYSETDVLEVMANMVGAYHQVLPLEDAEVDHLLDLIAARLAFREIIVNWRLVRHGDTGSYDAKVSEMTWEALSRVMDHDPEAATQRLRDACGYPSNAQVAVPMDALLQRRKRLLGPTAKQFYERCFHPVRAEGIWIYDETGKRYLDAYNNVPHVGHCHPHVTAAIIRQANRLNTNTRYLDETILDYSERLTSTLSNGLDTVVVVCTGTEANDLAWQVARAWSGGTGAIVTYSAFHGNSTLVSRLDTFTLPVERREEWVATVDPPMFPGRIAAHQSHLSAEDYARQYEIAIEALSARGYDPAAFYMCPLFASDGLYSPPKGYMDKAIQSVRQTGALIVSDEVQSGFGRTGDDMWGYQALGVTPDIVTLGKPIGNGHPLGALVTRREIMERFARSERYFNTFGGNPVACAAGLAVLDVLEREDLLRNAREVGAHLRLGLESLGTVSPLVRDVRGRGLFLGVDLAVDGEAAPAVARQVIEEMHHRGVLIGITGSGRNLLKIRPPMCVTKANADQIVETLGAVLQCIAIEGAS